MHQQFFCFVYFIKALFFLPQHLESLKKDYASLEKKAHDRLIEDNMSEDEIVIQRVADCRYEGQGYEMRVPVIGGEVTEETIEKMKESFHIAH